ncbi:39S ribosomal protein L37, mitochondrial [Osmerus mordax]|uniref:Large ribosomal subunit protein mL37 n=1 Tax=Osmerus mordax TaxID=8014 RepID=C1BMA0_OSMMO|nr:39S ribosomal protein L37, mitochondrial precursor [Osmerus mordax]
MFTESAQRLRSAVPLLAQTTLLNETRNSVKHGAALSRVHGRRHFNVSPCLSVRYILDKVRTEKPQPHVKVEIPGLERITYADRMHYIPGLSKPKFPTWERSYKDQQHYKCPKAEDMPLYKKKPCYVFHQRTNVVEGVKQALWLTKSKMIKGLPAQVLSLADDPANQIPNQDEMVQNAIKHSRFWDTTEQRPPRQKFCLSLMRNLLHLCGGLQVRHPALGRRILAEKYSPVATWSRGEELFQVRGQNGLLLSSTAPLPVLAGKEEVEATVDHTLETFYPLSPTIDLSIIHLYQESNHTGFRGDYPYPHPHTLFFMEDGSTVKLLADQLRAKMIMFAFGNALARAHALYGSEAGELDRPVVVQAVGSNGRMFQYVILQLNTTSLQSDHGAKNLVWVEEDQELYDYAKIRPLIRKKVVQVPAGLSGYQPETFRKFLSLYLHGAV